MWAFYYYAGLGKVKDKLTPAGQAPGPLPRRGGRGAEDEASTERYALIPSLVRRLGARTRRNWSRLRSEPKLRERRERNLRAPAARGPDGQPGTQHGRVVNRDIRSVLENAGGNRTRAAEILGISREGLRVKMPRLGLSEKKG